MRPIDQFRLNFTRVRDLGGLYHAVTALTTEAVESSDLLRSQLVMGVSALDHFVHEFVVAGMIEVFDGRLAPTPAFSRFSVPAGHIIGSASLSTAAFEQCVRDAHSYLSFQNPDRIADGIRLISDIELWNTLAPHFGDTPKSLKNRLSLIVDRRNKIVHEADMDPSYPSTRWPIQLTDVENALILVEKICEEIHAEIGL